MGVTAIFSKRHSLLLFSSLYKNHISGSAMFKEYSTVRVMEPVTYAQQCGLPEIPSWAPINDRGHMVLDSPEVLARDDPRVVSKLRVVSYNILAQKYAKSDIYPYTRKSWLRAEWLLKRNIEYNDLVKPIEDEMSSSVKNGRILKVTGNADSQQSHGSNNEDCKEDLGDPNDPRIRLKRDCVGIMGAFRLLKYSDTDHIFIIANTHIDWDPECIDVKLAQAKYLIQCIGRFKTRISEVFRCKPSVIVTGNFASTPGDQVYNYLTSVPIVECPEPDKSLDKLTSFYASSPAGEPKFTTFTSEFKGTLDYIFYSPCGGVLQPIGLLEVPSADFPTMKRIEGLPTLQHPSDHLPIGAVFEIPTRIRKLSQA